MTSHVTEQVNNSSQTPATEPSTTTAQETYSRSLLAQILAVYQHIANLATEKSEGKLARVKDLNGTLKHINDALADLGKVYAEVKEGDAKAVSGKLAATGASANEVAEQTKEVSRLGDAYNTSEGDRVAKEQEVAKLKSAIENQKILIRKIESGEQIGSPDHARPAALAAARSLLSMYETQLEISKLSLDAATLKAKNDQDLFEKANGVLLEMTRTLKDKITSALAAAHLPSDTVLFGNKKELDGTQKGADINAAVTKLQSAATTRGNEISTAMTESSEAMSHKNSITDGHKSFIDKWYHMLSQAAPH